MRGRLVAAAFALTALAACSGTRTPVSNASRAPNGGLVPVRVSAFPTVGSQALRPLGVPAGTAGAYLTVFVHGGERLYFDAGGNPVAAPGKDQVLLPASGPLTLQLPSGQAYDFKADAVDNLATPTTIAYGEVLGVTVAGAAPVGVDIPLHSLLNSAEFTPLPAVTRAYSGQRLNLKLGVHPVAPAGARVPPGDYSVSYAVSGGSKALRDTIPIESKLGVQVIAGSGPDPLTVTATISGLLPPAPGTPGTLTVTFSVPVVAVSNVGADLAPPEVAINPFGPVIVGNKLTLSGTASDDRWVSSVEVYAGVELLGEATFGDLGDWSFDWYPQEGQGDITVVAYDAAGNAGFANAAAYATVPISNFDALGGASLAGDLAPQSLPCLNGLTVNLSSLNMQAPGTADGVLVDRRADLQALPGVNGSFAGLQGVTVNYQASSSLDAGPGVVVNASGTATLTLYAAPAAETNAFQAGYAIAQVTNLPVTVVNNAIVLSGSAPVPDSKLAALGAGQYRLAAIVNAALTGSFTNCPGSLGTTLSVHTALDSLTLSGNVLIPL